MSGVARIPERHIEAATARVRAMREAFARGEAVYGPYLAPCVCGDGIHAHAGDGHRGKCADCSTCQRYRADVVDVLVQRALEGSTTSFSTLLRRQDAQEYAARPRTPSAPGEWSVRVSDIGACGRALGYRNGLAGADYTPVPKFDGEALAGRIVEAAVVRVNAKEYPWRQWQREVQVKGIPRVGRIDEYDPIDGCVTDIKSCGEWKWEHVETYGVWGSASLHNLKQVCLYADQLERDGAYVAHVRLHYIKRDTFEEQTFTLEWDDKLRAVAEEARTELIGRQTMLDISADTGELPERDRDSASHPLCKRCDALEHCWGTTRAAALGRTPESLTFLGEDPDEDQIVWACERIIATRAAKDDATRAYDAANQLIDKSVKPGPYGPARVEKGRSGGINHKALAEAYFEEAERRGVDLSTVPVPHNADSKPVVKLRPLAQRQPDTVPAPTGGAA